MGEQNTYSKIDYLLLGHSILIFFLSIPYNRGWSEYWLYAEASGAVAPAAVVFIIVMYVNYKMEVNND